MRKQTLSTQMVFLLLLKLITNVFATHYFLQKFHILRTVYLVTIWRYRMSTMSSEIHQMIHQVMTMAVRHLYTNIIQLKMTGVLHKHYILVMILQHMHIVVMLYQYSKIPLLLVVKV